MKTETATTELTPIMEKFILHWGEMGSTWGINRAVAQIYAILYLSPAPLTAEEISHKLSLARSTVSTGIRELQGWGLVKVVHVLGDRRDHFAVMSSVWDMFRAILNERKRREVDPTLLVLQECVSEIQDDETEDEHVLERLQDMLDIFQAMTSVYDQLDRVPTQTLKSMARLGDQLTRVLGRISEG